MRRARPRRAPGGSRVPPPRRDERGVAGWDRLCAARGQQITEGDDAARDLQAHAVAAIDRLPLRAAHGRRRVAALGAEAAVPVAPQAANDAMAALALACGCRDL